MGVQFPTLLDRLHTKTNCLWIILGDWDQQPHCAHQFHTPFFFLDTEWLVGDKTKALIVEYVSLAHDS